MRRWVAGTSGSPAAEAALRVDDVDAPVDVLLDPRDEDGGTPPRAPRGGRTRRDAVPLGSPRPHALLGRRRQPPRDRRRGASRSSTWRRRRCASSSSRRTSSSTWRPRRAARRGPFSRAGRARRVVALERNATRARRLASGLSAAGRRGEVLVVRADSSRPPLPRGSFRSVLLDAPCSGTGTLRKNPEIRWRLSPDDLPALAGAQRALLHAALDLCAPGGSVCYVTCSLEPEENEEVVDGRPGRPLRTRRSSLPTRPLSPRRWHRRFDRTGSSGSLRAFRTTVSPPWSSERAKGAAEYAAFPLTRPEGNPTFHAVQGNVTLSGA